jgi:hypothetical protein
MSSESFDKRERERRRDARAAEKRQRREARLEETDGDPVDADGLMEQFRVLNERHASGHVDNETFEAQRSVILEQLGLN